MNDSMKDRAKWTQLEDFCWSAILNELPAVKRGDLNSARELVDADKNQKAFVALDFLEYCERLSKIGQDPEADKYVGDPDEMLSTYAASFAALWWREPAALAQSMVDEENLKIVLQQNPFVTFDRHLITKAQVLRLDLKVVEAEAILSPLFERLLNDKDSAFVNAGWLLAEILFERNDDLGAVAVLQKMAVALEPDESKVNILAETRRRMKPSAQN